MLDRDLQLYGQVRVLLFACLPPRSRDADPRPSENRPPDLRPAPLRRPSGQRAAALDLRAGAGAPVARAAAAHAAVPACVRLGADAACEDGDPGGDM